MAANKVLVVDDCPTDLANIKGIVTDAGCTVYTASNGAEAIEKAKAEKPDVIFLDILMPDMDGYTLLMKLREFHPDVPVLAISGYVKDDDIREYDFDGFVAKPMQADEFKNAVATALATR